MTDERAAKLTVSAGSEAPRAAFWSLVEVSFRHGGQLIVALVLARILSPADFGRVGMLLVITSISALFIDAGLGSALVQKQTVSRDDESSAFWFGVFAASGFWLIIFLTAPWIAAAFAEPKLAILLPFMALTLPLTAFAIVPDALLARELRFDQRARIEALSAIVSTAFSVLLAVLGFGVWALIAQAISFSACRSGGCWTVSGWRPIVRFRWKSLQELWKFGGNLMIAGLLDVVSLRLQSALIGRLYGSSALGLYTIAHTSFQGPVLIVGAMLNRVGLAILSRRSNQATRLLATLRVFIRGATFFFAPVMLSIALLSEPLIQVAFGPDWIEAAPVLSILALSGIFWPIHVLNQVAINAMGRSDLFLKLAIVKKCIAVALIVYGSLHGVIGVACALLISSIFALPLNAIFLSRLIPYGVRAQCRDHMGTLAALAAQALVGVFILMVMLPSSWRAALLVLLPNAAYFATAHLIRHRTLAEFTQLIRMARASVLGVPQADVT